jgi:hypothetical protein
VSIYLCDFMNDGKPGACQEPAEWRVRKSDLCDFHKGFMYAVDYQNELPKPRKLRKPVPGTKEGV